MFDMNPLNLPDAQLQQLIMLFVAGMLGFIIGYMSRQGIIRQLEGDLASTERAVDDCLRMPVVSAGLSTEESLVLNRVRARAGELNFSRIGIATAAQADDLKVIVGVGPFLEKKLHAIGIYTFRQIANFTPEDVEKVNDIIEFFPGRIERDNWVGQAAELAKK
ncbi:hypothetical protein [Spirosoma montaniterrae]|uniref:50S ribosomal protein L21 n=1 Tax=Spirosoma montaniterrae TaxID=1178516 RepID=A0A1P9WTS4_9BACT|nr:hypothetical protein [Spirosoma montaniterrae]AQG78796.1 hypothetical protein AWR27_05320 [Spirosoma montaniterrae]